MGDNFSLLHENINVELIVHFENYPGSLFGLTPNSTILARLYYKRWARLQKKGKNPSFCFCLIRAN